METGNPNIYQKDYTCSIDKHERLPDRDDANNHQSKRREGFSPEDVIVLCADVVRSENILIDANGLHKKDGGGISHKLADVKASLIRRGSKLLGLDGGAADDDGSEVNQNTEAIPGLHGRDVVAVAILVGKDGERRSYTENEEIPSDDMETAGDVFLTRIPVDKTHESAAGNEGDSDSVTKSLVDILSHELDADARKKLVKRMERSLARLHTTDLRTARSFLKTERYANVRSSMKSELLAFLAKDLKIQIVCDLH